MAGWKKTVALAAVLGLAVLLWMYIDLSPVDHEAKETQSLEREKMAEDSDREVHVDEAAAIEYERALKVAKIAQARSRSKSPKGMLPSNVRLGKEMMTKGRGAGGERDAIEKGENPVAAKSGKTSESMETKEQLLSQLQKSKPSLPASVINGVEKFVFFIGYQRSGHSIIGSFMDAHPHMVIAHEFMLFAKWKEMEEKYALSGEKNPLRNKEMLFNELYRDSCADANHGWRSGQLRNKNYSLSVDSQWQGRYDRFIKVLGDKSGGATTTVYTSSPHQFEQFLSEMKETVGVPIRVLHVVRNPYDMIATDALYSEGKRRRDKTGVRQAVFVSNVKRNLTELRAAGKVEAFKAARLNNLTLLESRTKSITRLANGNKNIIHLIGEENVLELHNVDLVNDPISTLRKICVFLDIDCSDSYLKTCADKVFKTISNTRELVVWPDSTKRKVEALIKQHTFFQRYSYDKD